VSRGNPLPSGRGGGQLAGSGNARDGDLDLLLGNVEKCDEVISNL
jgi:hypothetical protein